MTEITTTLVLAKEKFDAGKVEVALKLANLANKSFKLSQCGQVPGNLQGSSCFYYIDLAMLGLKNTSDPSTCSIDKITGRYCKLAKLLHPNVNSSCAAPRALQHITKAWEILTDAPRGGMRLLPPSKRTNVVV